MIRLMTMVMLVKVMRKSSARLSHSAVDVSAANGLHDDGRTGHDQSDHHDVRSSSPSSLSLSTSPSSSLSSSFVMAILIVERIPHGQTIMSFVGTANVIATIFTAIVSSTTEQRQH